MAAHSIDFIDKDNTRRLLVGLLKEVAHAACTHTDEHLYEVRTGDGEEWNTCLTGNSSRQECLASTWRTQKEDTTWDLATKAREAAWITEELNDFTKFFLRLVCTSYIKERHQSAPFRLHSCTTLSK